MGKQKYPAYWTEPQDMAPFNNLKVNIIHTFSSHLN
jgi:hypothetical protein